MYTINKKNSKLIHKMYTINKKNSNREGGGDAQILEPPLKFDFND